MNAPHLLFSNLETHTHFAFLPSGTKHDPQNNCIWTPKNPTSKVTFHKRTPLSCRATTTTTKHPTPQLPKKILQANANETVLWLDSLLECFFFLKKDHTYTHTHTHKHTHTTHTHTHTHKRTKWESNASYSHFFRDRCKAKKTVNYFLGDLRSLVRFVSFWKKQAKLEWAKSNHL